MDDIFARMDNEKRFSFDKSYIDDLYFDYMTRDAVHGERLEEFKNYINNKNVLIICPGKSSKEEKEKIIDFSRKSSVVTISVNFEYLEDITDFIFLSNFRRYRELDKVYYKKCIVTSNIPDVGSYLQTDYNKLLNDVDFVRDNSCLMLIKLLADLGVKNIYLAGLDGYSTNISQNFIDNTMSFHTNRSILQAMNKGINKVLSMYKDKINIKFLTKQYYVTLYNETNEKGV